MSRIKQTIAIVANILWIGLTFYLMVKPNKDEPPLFVGADKIAHAAVFAIMVILLNLMIKGVTTLHKSAINAISILAVTAFGAAMEVVQQEFFQRSCDFYDLVADFCGAILGAILFPMTYKVIHKWSLCLFKSSYL